MLRSLEGSDASVQGTNDDAQISKMSCAKAGYFRDEFIHLFVRRASRRSPLINRGYYSRHAALRQLLASFLAAARAAGPAAPQPQVLVLGAGFDTTWFQLCRDAGGRAPYRCLEVDFKEVTSRKAAVIAREASLLGLLAPRSAPQHAQHGPNDGGSGSGSGGGGGGGGTADAGAAAAALAPAGAADGGAGPTGTAAASAQAGSGGSDAGGGSSSGAAATAPATGPPAGPMPPPPPLPRLPVLGSGVLGGGGGGGGGGGAGPGSAAPPAVPEGVAVDVAGGRVLSGGYCLLPVDLRDLAALEAAVETAGLDRGAPTLVLSECVLVYMEAAASAGVVRWAAGAFRNALLAIYEQIKPDDAFGRQMVANLEARGCPLRGLPATPSLQAHRDRLLRGGWASAEAADMDALYGRWLDPADRARVERLELFDELEEWHMIQEHYCIALGRNDADGWLGGVTLTRPPQGLGQAGQAAQLAGG